MADTVDQEVLITKFNQILDENNASYADHAKRFTNITMEKWLKPFTI